MEAAVSTTYHTHYAARRVLFAASFVTLISAVKSIVLVMAFELLGFHEAIWTLAAQLGIITLACFVTAFSMASIFLVSDQAGDNQQAAIHEQVVSEKANRLGAQFAFGASVLE